MSTNEYWIQDILILEQYIYIDEGDHDRIGSVNNNLSFVCIEENVANLLLYAYIGMTRKTHLYLGFGPYRLAQPL